MGDGAVFSQGMVLNGSYIFMDRLLAINSCVSPLSQSLLALPREVNTPLNAHQWSQDLQSHPDIRFQSYIVEGIASGFRIGFDRSHSLRSATKNLHSSKPAVILEYLEQEVCLNRTWKFPINKCSPGFHVSPVGAIP